MLLLGVCNPAGENNSYNGLYFKQSELNAMAMERSLIGVPVKAEHSGADVGSVCSAFLNSSGALSCVIDVPENTLQGSVVANLVRDGVALDLSMGYSVDVQHSGKTQKPHRTLKAGKKKTLEISLVRKGAREGCHILAYEDNSGQCKWRKNKHTTINPTKITHYQNDFKQFFANSRVFK